MVEIKRRKTDRRTLYTIRVIKDAFIKLLKLPTPKRTMKP